MAQCPQADERSPDVEEHLHHVGPDDSGHSAFERVEQGERGDDGDRRNVARADGDADDDGDGEDAHALGRGARQQKQSGGDLVQARAEAAVDELVGGEEFALEIFR